MKKLNNKGFTLLEVILVISIIGILVTMVAPNFSKSQLSARVATHNADVNMIKSAVALYLIDHPLETTKYIDMSLIEKYLDKDSDLNVDPVLVREAKIKDKFEVEINDSGEIEIIPGELVFIKGDLIKKGQSKDE